MIRNISELNQQMCFSESKGSKKRERCTHSQQLIVRGLLEQLLASHSGSFEFGGFWNAHGFFFLLFFLGLFSSTFFFLLRNENVSFVTSWDLFFVPIYGSAFSSVCDVVCSSRLCFFCEVFVDFLVFALAELVV